MTNLDRIKKLTTYENTLVQKLADKNVPDKHTGRPESYKQFLERELETVKKKISSLKV